MRIRIVVHRYRPDVGGTEQMSENLATAMVGKGHEVEVVTLRTGPAPADEWMEVPAAVSGGAAGRYRIRRLDYLGDRLRIPVGYWRVLREPTDLIHVFGNRIWCSDFFLPVANHLRAKTVLTGQNFYQLYMRGGLLNELYFQRYFPRMAERVDAYVVQTKQERDQLRRFGYRGPVSLIPHTVDLAELDRDPRVGEEFRRRHALGDRRVLLSSGGFMPNKRMDRVLSAVALAHDPWTVVLTGKDSPGHPYDLAHCRALARDRGLDVRFLGEGSPLPWEEVVAAFYACTVYGQGSSYEGYGGAVQEAMTVRKPFVAFATGAIPEFAEARAGFSVESVEDFARALDTLANDAGLRRTLGDAGRAEVLRGRDKSAVMGAYDQLFRAVVAGGETASS